MTDAIKQATSHWEVGNVKITRVIELEHVGFPPGFLFDGLTEDRVKSIGWLHPHYADPDGIIRISVHSYVIESQGRRIIVDTCVGNDKPRSMDNWNMMKVPFLERRSCPGWCGKRKWRILPVSWLTQSRPPGKAATGGMRHGRAYQEQGAAA